MIRVDGVSKAFRLYSKPSDRLRELILRRTFHHHHQALDDISFTLEQGRTLGIIGQNGAGKSTLLKLLTGILLPDRGRIELSGRITGLLELGTGFNAEMSGLHNIRNNAALLGMTRAEIDERLPAMVAFAELGDFIGEPMHTYSSGMLMRLGFAVAIHADPACFVVDEALAVGDAYFQQKCMRAIHAFRESGGSVLFVSHDMGAVRALCDEVLLLEDGRVIDRGSPRAVVDHYHGIILRKTHAGDVPVALHRASEPPQPPAEALGPDARQSTADAADGASNAQSDQQPTGSPSELPSRARANVAPLPSQPLARTGQATLLDVRVVDADGQTLLEVISEQRFGIEVRLRIEQPLSEPYYGIGLRDRLGQSAFETNTFFVSGHSAPVAAGSEVCIRWDLDGNLRQGEYGVTVGIANRADGDGRLRETILFAHEVAILRIARNPDSITYEGWCNLHPTVRVDLCSQPSQGGL